MYKYRLIQGLSSFAVLSSCLVSPSALAASVDETVKTRSTIETIIVIGEKSEKSLKDTTSSVSVISEEALQSMQYQTITDAVSEIPNVVALSGAVPDIRGVSGNGSAGGFNSISGGAKARVSILIDGIAEPFVADLTGDSGIWDIEQIEVYRGPQSTSNGRNSIGGSMYIKTKDPSFVWGGKARLGFRNQDGYVDTSAVVTGPIIDDTLAFRISAQHLDAETITDETGFATNPPNYDLNEIKTNRLKGKLLWTPTQEIDVLFAYSSNHEQGDTGRIYYAADNPSAHRRLFFRNIDTDSDTTSLTLDYQISDSISLDVLFAVMDYKWGFDSYEANPGAQQILRFDESNTTFDAKINFGLNNTALNGFIGLAYFERNQDIGSTGSFVYGGDDGSDSKAIYGEVNFALSNALNLTLGGRLERESQHRNFTFAPINAVLDQSKTISLPKIVLQYAVSDQTTFALSARKGYNSAGGALNFTAQEYYFFDQETVNTVEASVRSSLTNSDVSFSANLFYNEYDGYQALSSTRFIINMEKVATYGAELEIVARPNTNFEIRAGLGLLHTDIKDAGDQYAAASGNELNSAPQITANLGAKFWLTPTFNVGMSVNYVDDYFGDFTNTEERVAGGYTLTRINANYETGKWLIAAFVNNALDQDKFISREPASRRYATGYVSVLDPRNIGISATYSF